MQSVLGIDAAWTDANPSGVALVRRHPTGGWECVAVAPSAGEFLRRAAGEPVDWEHPAADALDPKALVARASTLLSGHPISCVAMDVPLARSPITGRRIADDEVSRAFGRARCGTHSPTATRPGAISERLRRRCEEAGFRLVAKGVADEHPSLIEVYPHPAVVRLCGLSERAPYKVSRRRAYWREAPPAERTRRMLLEWERIVAALGRELAGVGEHFAIPAPDARTRTLKSHEDALDALICAWVGACYLEGRAEPYGDADAAIWIPA